VARVPQPSSVAAGRERGSKQRDDRDDFVRPDAADRFVDELLPESVDWRHLVTTYPLASVTVASIAGFLLARSKGGLVVAALGSYVAARFSDAIVELADEPLDPRAG
jgi:hypothetical protein